MEMFSASGSASDSASTSDSDSSVEFSVSTLLELEGVYARIHSVSQSLTALGKRSAQLEMTLSFYTRPWPAGASRLVTVEDRVHEAWRSVGIAGRSVNGVPVYAWLKQLLTE